MSDRLLGPKELMARLGLKKSRFHTLQRAGAFDRFRTHPPIGRRCYAADLVDRWERGERLLDPTFGRKRAS